MAIHIRRRELLAALVSWPLVARAREPIRHIGVFQPGNETDAHFQGRQTVFVDSLRKLGWSESNCLIHTIWTSEDFTRMRLAASELVALRPDVLFTSGGYPLLVCKRATHTIPIVFTTVYDPVGSGFVTNLSHPGGNITGFTCGEFSMGGKILEVLKQTAPGINRVAVLLNLEQPPHVAMWRSIEATAPLLGVHAFPADSPNFDEIELAMKALAGESNGGVIMLPSPIANLHRVAIAEQAIHYRLPAAFPFSFYTASGGLLSYGIDPTDQARQATGYIDRILKGEKPGDLPIQQPTKFDLVINMKTAKALGLEISTELLARADEVIE